MDDRFVIERLATYRFERGRFSASRWIANHKER